MQAGPLCGAMPSSTKTSRWAVSVLHLHACWSQQEHVAALGGLIQCYTRTFSGLSINTRAQPG